MSTTSVVLRVPDWLLQEVDAHVLVGGLSRHVGILALIARGLDASRVASEGLGVYAERMRQPRVRQPRKRVSSRKVVEVVSSEPSVEPVEAVPTSHVSFVVSDAEVVDEASTDDFDDPIYSDRPW